MVKKKKNAVAKVTIIYILQKQNKKKTCFINSGRSFVKVV